MTYRRLNLFPTPLIIDRLPDAETINSQLESVIVERMKSDSGLKRSNTGGWHSSMDLLDWGGPAIRQVADHAISLANANTSTVGGAELRWKTTAWANVNGPGAGNSAHIHGGNYWAAVYYVKVGDGDGGRLRLHDPRLPGLRMHAPLLRFTKAGREVVHRVEPQAGQILLFPAWLMHSVEDWRGEGERISIAMNIRWVRRPKQR